MAEEKMSKAAQEREVLVKSLRHVISDAEEILAATADHADSKLEEIRARARHNLDRARVRIEDIEDVVRENAHRAARVTDDYVRENPWSSLGIAAVAGLLMGALISRR